LSLCCGCRNKAASRDELISILLPSSPLRLWRRAWLLATTNPICTRPNSSGEPRSLRGATVILRYLRRPMDLRKVLVTELDDITLLPASKHSDLRHRRLARYNDEFVLLDPKDYGENPDDSSGDKVYDRVKALAKQLSSFPWRLTGEDGIWTLLCKGWYEDQSTSQFYFVFRLPPECEEPCQPKSLYQIYRTSKPSVGTRIRLARSLAITIRKIHESGWLHKGIRSDHVLFFPRRPGGRPDLDNPRLVGFDFARRDGPYEYSDKPM